ncbi:hypothetical protein ONZ45_g3318 [Pleurotus djamor]|nr:hypothetical protein ONZ45_g3318 [Pleurotus djamor]
MKYFVAFAFAALQAAFVANAAALFIVPDGHIQSCYQTSNFGSRVHNCGSCKEGHHFIPTGFCDIGFECCKGMCCYMDFDSGSSAVDYEYMLRGGVPDRYEMKCSELPQFSDCCLQVEDPKTPTARLELARPNDVAACCGRRASVMPSPVFLSLAWAMVYAPLTYAFNMILLAPTWTRSPRSPVATILVFVYAFDISIQQFGSEYTLAKSPQQTPRFTNGDAPIYQEIHDVDELYSFAPMMPSRKS